MTKLSKITPAQLKALDILREVGGWSCSKQLDCHGGNVAAAMALVKHGLVEERRSTSRWGTLFCEWRAAK